MALSEVSSREARIRELSPLRGSALQALRVYEIFATDDVTVAQHKASQLMTPHQLRVRAQRFHGRMCATPLGSSSAISVEYTDGSTVEHVEEADYYTVVATLSGSVAVTGTRSVACGPGDLVVLPPAAEMVLKYHGDCQLLAVRTPQETVHRTRSALLRTRRHDPPSFRPQIFDVAARAAWIGALTLTLSTAARSSTGMPRAVGETLEQSLLSALILGHGAPAASVHGPGPSTTLGKQTIERTAAVIEAAYAEPIPIAEIARRMGVGTRRLQIGFQQVFGMSPSVFRRDIRLRHAHEQLLAAAATDTVADIACRCGFAHLGRFSQAYRARYGSTPSATLHS